MSTAVLGLQWGDEGKGKIAHLLARDADVVVRFNGGPNAGHTLIDRGVRFGTHMVPAGVFYPDTVSVLAAGMVIDLVVLTEEIAAVAQHTGRTPEVLVAENAHLILPYHRVLEELEGSGSHFGTTRRGISPAYRDKAAHVGIRAGDLLRPEELQTRLRWRLDLLKRAWPTSEEMQSLSPRGLTDELLRRAEPLVGSITDATSLIRTALDDGRNVLFEGAQGTLLDVDHGTYPYVTSSSTTFAGLGNGIGVPSPAIACRLGVSKAYQTRVGEGPFPTELDNDIGRELRERGGEYGVTTRRPRRCGWLDLVALRYAVSLNDVTGIVLTKLDVLAGEKEINVCRAYRVDGRETTKFPFSGAVLEECVPIYETLAGWTESLGGVRSFSDLPRHVRDYVHRIEQATEVPVVMVSVGAGPEETIYREL
jgi:adenylosuccinate synthase